MYMEIEKYRILRLAQDEICVAAAFLNITGLYGVSGRWIKTGEALNRRVMQAVMSLEQKGLLLPEPGGVIRMEPKLYGLIRCMGQAGCVGRIGFTARGGQRRLYLYRIEETAVFLEQDGRGECFLGYLPSKAGMEWLWTDTFRTQAEDSDDSWLGALLFRKRSSCFEPVLDLAWTESGQEEFEKAWSRVCHAFWESHGEREENV